MCTRSGEACNGYIDDIEGSRRQLALQYGTETANRVINACIYGKRIGF